MQQLYQLTMPDQPLMPSIQPGANSEFHIVESAVGTQLFIVDGSRLFGIEPQDESTVRVALQNNQGLESLISEYINPPDKRAINPIPIQPPPLRSLSLNVAQTCNMACSYCYADEGRFGGKSRLMTKEVAFQAIDRLFQDSDHDEPVVVGFMGGEPLVNRELVHEATRYAVNKANGKQVRFSVTTNGTLITENDACLFHEFPFTVQISIDFFKKPANRD